VSDARQIIAIDVCAGAGGWAVAARGLPIHVALAVDNWDAACRTYEINHPETTVLHADLRDEATRASVLARCRELGGVDLVLGGIPCQWLSVLRRIKIDKRGAVTEEEKERERATLTSVLGLVGDLAPRWWCLEDVIQIVRELPEGTPHVVIDAQQYCGQRRKRAYVGVFPMPEPGHDERVLGDYLRPGPYRIGRRAFDRVPVRSRQFQQGHIYPDVKKRKASTVRRLTSNRDGELALFRDGFNDLIDLAEQKRKSPVVRVLGSRHDNDLNVEAWDLPTDRRQFEWQELAALQGFPGNYVFFGSPTDTQAMIGNAVQIDTGRAILEAIVAEWRATGDASP